MMKKYIGLFLVLLFCLGVTVASAEDITGYWYLNEGGMGGLFMHPADVCTEAAMDINNAGGSVYVVREGGQMTSSADATWKKSGEEIIITENEKQLTCTLTDGKLTAQTGDVTLVFGREQIRRTITPGKLKTDATLADYKGTWKFMVIDELGEGQKPAYKIGQAIEIRVTDSGVFLKWGEINGFDELIEEEAFATVENGLMTLATQYLYMPDIQLYDNDVMLWEESVYMQVGDVLEDAVIKYYFEKKQDILK